MKKYLKKSKDDRKLDRACAAMREALEKAKPIVDFVIARNASFEEANKAHDVIVAALSDTAGQELLANIADLETSRQHYKDLLHAEERDCEAAEKALFAAKELFREIRDGEVNEQDEADKFLRDHQPSALSLSQARVKALEDALQSIVNRKSFDSTEAAVEWMERIAEQALTQPPV